ncbi:GerAB/ArcD/ProY family transporter [Mangrovibacillus cuniculi]|uniref:GerAB/ArcD/ProY family transporter n=1 Tax=Mangrovibacillus cuniculi TaxID=2593652 RepID=A0A7S8HGD0_9BACI|nr:GerAB/ArcD/ProY family transporter [Mangrovibacillus cuniculi]QPC47421.1 GerAB/ArcD/ProY family transporter [Mangrovibacillus cuniculi]
MKSIPEAKKISPYLAFFLIHSTQVGVGVLGFQRIVASEAGYDSWISVIAAGLSIHFIYFFMYGLLQKGGGDIVGAHRTLFGKWLAKPLDLFFAVYFMSLCMTALRTYIEVIQVWMFPEMNGVIFGAAFMVLSAYVVSSGLRTVTGISFFGMILPSYLILTFFFTIPFAQYRNFLPLFDHNLTELIKASISMSLTYLGYEMLLMIYPFIKRPEESKKWTHGALVITTGLYTLTALVTFSFFSEEQLTKTVWATLSIWKIVQLPFVERFEYIGIANWCLIILPNVCVPLWCASRILKRSFRMRQRTAMWFFVILIVGCIPLLDSRLAVNTLNDVVGKIGLYINYIYIPLLFAVLFIKRKVSSQNEKK